MNSRYLEITSAHRDRTRFPNPSQFNVELSLSGQKNAYSAIDPVYQSVVKYPPPNLEYPTVYSTFGYMYGLPTNGSSITSEYTVGILPIVKNTNYQYELINPLGNASRNMFENGFENGYIGDTLELVQCVSGGSVIASNEYRKIVYYRVIPSTDTNAYITGTVVSVPTSNSIVLNINCNIDNFITGWEIEFMSTTDPNLRGKTAKITAYRAYDKCVFLNMPILDATITPTDTFILKIPIYEVHLSAPFSVGALPLLQNNCSTTNYTTYRIRSNSSYPLTSGTFVSGTTNTFVLPSSVGTTDYTNQLLWVQSNPVIYTGSLASAGFISSGGVQIQGTFTLSTNIFNNDFLNNMTLTVTSGAFAGYSYLITDWDASTLTGKINLGWTSALSAPLAGTTIQITQLTPYNYYKIISYTPSTRTGTIIPYFNYYNLINKSNTYSITSSDTFEILQFKHDNYHPLDYAESMVHQQQIHCYEITLISLTIPNVPLKTGTGGHIAFYPYVYIEFKSITQGTSAYNFNSNNPVVQKNIMFKAPMVYNYHPNEAAFITLDGHGMVQQLKFKPNDSFSFAVYLPNGELFLTEEDYKSPSEPNPLLQITACFGIRRI
jgi:hypothetical protein